MPESTGAATEPTGHTEPTGYTGPTDPTRHAVPTGHTGPERRRDPRRRQRILRAAADLVAQRGYHDVGMSDIGAAAGITGSGIYRHFTGKPAVLVAMFDRVIDDLSSEAAQIVVAGGDPRTALRDLIGTQVRFVLSERTLAQVYHNEITNLPDDDRHRLRRKQRLYVEEWVHVLAIQRPDVSDGELRALVHAAIGAIQSVLFYQSGLPGEQLARLMESVAEAVLFAVTDPPPVPEGAADHGLH